MANYYADVYSFLDYRKYLTEYYNKRAVADKKFTKASICHQLGLPNSRSYFGDILSGKKNLSNIKMELMIQILRTKGDEAQYFRFLVQYNQTTVKAEKEFFFEQLIALNKTPQKLVDPSTYAYYKAWYHSAIRAMLDVYDIKDDYYTIAKKLYPAITPSLAKESIELLKKLKFIRKNKKGYWKPTDQIIKTGSYVQHELVKKYQVACLEIAIQAILNHSEERQNISTETISCSDEAYSKIENKLQKFKEEVRSVVQKDTEAANKVYQMNIQLFPQSS